MSTDAAPDAKPGPAPGPGPGPAPDLGLGLARRATADPLFRLATYALEAAHGRRPTAVWSAPHAFRLAPAPGPDRVAAAGWPVAAAAAPRADGLVRLSSLSHPAHSCDLPLALDGPPPDGVPDWAARTYGLLRALARAGHGRGGTDLHVHGALTPAAGLSTAEPADCAVALAVADVHGPAGTGPDREELAGLLAEALPAGPAGGDDGLRRAVLFARPGEALLPEPGGPRRYVPFDPPGSGVRLLLMAVRGAPADRAADLGQAAELLQRAGAAAVWAPGRRAGRSVLVLLPEERVTAARAGVAAEFRGRSRPVPRFLNVPVAGAARREE
ncbi:galactokinase [Streptomyces sp. NPDC048603]|uniref:galactokinase n=1 Tax=Streptomyces sp. NPDC048603 TaxID=3365577 RepID=UPI00371885A4